MKKLSLLLLLVSLVALVEASAQNIVPPSFIKLDSFLVAANKNQWLAGHTVLVIKDGQTVFSHTYGFRDREAKSLMKVDDIFRLASMSKAITTAAAMILVEQGKLKLEDRLDTFAPEFGHPQVLKSYDPKTNVWTSTPAATPITIKHLMTHTSGIGSSLDDDVVGLLYAKNGIPALLSGDSILLKTAMHKLAKLPLATQPGSKFHYGMSTDVLGYVIELVSKMPLDQFISRFILSPLKMKDTHFFHPERNRARLAVIYADPPKGKLSRIPQGYQGYNIDYPVSGHKKCLSGAAGLSGTITDYSKFLLMILNKGSLNGVRVLKPESVALMTKNQLGETSLANSNKFGLGFEIENRKTPPRGASIGKLSWGGAFNTTYWIDPKRNSIAILMSQVFPASHQRPLYSGFEQLTNEALDQNK